MHLVTKFDMIHSQPACSSHLFFKASAIARKLTFNALWKKNRTIYANGPLKTSIVSYFVRPPSSSISACHRSVSRRNLGKEMPPHVTR